MTTATTIELFAGHNSDGGDVVERLRVFPDDENSLKLAHSPAFVQGIAKGDLIRLDQDSRQFELIRRSGNLAIRVFARQDLEAIANEMTSALENLGGELDLESQRMLVYSVHVSCGFKTIESILNAHIDESNDSAWFYGNVYDPRDGVTPLNWWQAILSPE